MYSSSGGRAISRTLAQAYSVASRAFVYPRSSVRPTAKQLPTKLSFEFESVPCAVDERNDSALVRRFSFGGIPYSLVRCDGCGLEYINPQPTAASLKRLYSENYFSSPDSRLVGYANYLSEAESRINVTKQHIWLLSKLLGLDGKNINMLDCGCGCGFFVHAAERFFGYNAQGFDISEFAVGIARDRFGLQVQQGTVSDVSYPANQFDMVVMWDYLEHVKDPKEAIMKAYRWLKVGGHLVVRYPDNSSLLGKIMGQDFPHYKLDHIYFFNDAALSKLVSVAGFDPVVGFSDSQYFGVPDVFRLTGFDRAADLARKIGVGRRESLSTYLATQTVGNVFTLIGEADHSILIAQKK